MRRAIWLERSRRVECGSCEVGRLSDEFVHRVREATDLVALAGRHTDLRRSGRDRFVGRCPLHDDRTPSFTVSPSKQLFKCFGCGAGGDALTFVELADGVDFRTAVARLAEDAGIAPVVPRSSSPIGPRRDRPHAIELRPVDRAAAFYAAHLWTPRSAGAASALVYLETRGIGAQTCRRFKVGFAPASGTALQRAASVAGVSTDDLCDAGLVARSRDGAPQDRFRGRLMFPIEDLDGRVLGFGARKLNGGREPKYVNSPASVMFSKRELLFGAFHAQVAAARADVLIVTEGYFDVLALHEMGIVNAVALMGTAVSEQQVALMKRLAPAIVLMMDGDDAGREAAQRASALASALGVDARVAELPDRCDPAEMLQQHGVAGRAACASLCEQLVATARG